jgi:tetratricopeptide (TPR) repeat protein
LVLLDWQALKPTPGSGDSVATPQQSWRHDHAIGLGNLFPRPLADTTQMFQVQERLATFPPADLPPGQYQLQGRYLNRETGQTYPLPLPTTTLTLTSSASVNSPSPNPVPVKAELDLVTRFRQVIPALRQGKLDPVIALTGFAFRYDPRLDYLDQAIQASAARLKRNPQDLDSRYSLGLAQFLQQKTVALQTFAQISQFDRQNVYAWLYLGVANLYFWHPQAAEQAFNQAAQINPRVPELRPLQAGAALMQGHFFQAWKFYSASK